MASTESEVKALLDDWSDATRRKDIDRLMSLYSSDAVYFDVVPPLQITGWDGVRRNFLRWFDNWSSAIGQDVRERNIVASGDVAIAYMLIRASGTLKTGREVGYWVRATVGCKRSGQNWLIAHEHISIPIEFQSEKAMMTLEP